MLVLQLLCIYTSDTTPRQPISPYLRPLTPSQPDRLPVLLQLGDQLVSLAHHILVLLVLVIGPVRLDDAVARDAVNCARDAAGGDELGEVADSICMLASIHNALHDPISS